MKSLAVGFRTACVVAAVFLGGCGGGGGGGGSAPPQSITYQGNTGQATITTANAERFFDLMFGTTTADQIAPLSASARGEAIAVKSADFQLGERLRSQLSDRTQHAAGSGGSTATGVVINETDPCTAAGTVSFNGTLDDNTGLGDLRVHFNGCDDLNGVLNGDAVFHIRGFDGTFFTDLSIDILLLRLTSGASDLSVSGNIESLFNPASSVGTDTDNTVTRDNNTGRFSKTENLVRTSHTSGSPTLTVTGRVFDSVEGFVDASTTNPLQFAGSTSPFPFAGGPLVLAGAANSALVITPQSSTTVRLDVQSDGVVVAFATISWNAQNISFDVPSADLSIVISDIDPVVTGADLTYTLTVSNAGPGGAGGIQVQQTLPPEVTFVSASGGGWTCNQAAGVVTCTRAQLAAGAAADISVVVTAPATNATISTSATVSGTGADPNAGNNSATEQTIVASSFADLRVTAAGSPDVVAIGGTVTYEITVSNLSQFPAPDVAITDMLPANSTLVSAVTAGSCAGSTTVTCNVGTINAFDSVLLTVVATIDAQGIADNVAGATTTEFDPDAANNDATVSTSAGGTGAAIQTAIDAAASGATIFVGPGTYLGGVNFNGKNVSLESTDGPATTIINGQGGTGVRIGPSGAIKGFTITGSAGTFGAGMAVSGTGTLISGNVFDGNAENSGGSGAGIDGNGASPTIERNVFRNNTCDTQSGSGVVTFENTSSPLIVNNVFENNPCPAINLVLPAGANPKVINNTMVGNRIGVKVDFFGNVVVRNNIVVQNGVGLAVGQQSPVWENNLVFGNTTADYQGISDQTGTAGNVSVDPLFVDAASGDYHLQSGSPAIDAGGSTDAPAIDFDGTSRPQDGDGDATAAVDIGAFEVIP